MGFGKLRWTGHRPVTHHSLSTYNAFDNNPVFYADPSGADSDAGNFGLGRTGRYADNVQIYNFGMGAWRDSSGDNERISSYQTIMSLSKVILIE